MKKIILISVIVFFFVFLVLVVNGDIYNVIILGILDLYGYFMFWDYFVDKFNLSGSLS